MTIREIAEECAENTCGGCGYGDECRIVSEYLRGITPDALPGIFGKEVDVREGCVRSRTPDGEDA